MLKGEARKLMRVEKTDFRQGVVWLATPFVKGGRVWPVPYGKRFCSVGMQLIITTSGGAKRWGSTRNGRQAYIAQ